MQLELNPNLPQIGSEVKDDNGVGLVIAHWHGTHVRVRYDAGPDWFIAPRALCLTGTIRRAPPVRGYRRVPTHRYTPKPKAPRKRLSRGERQRQAAVQNVADGATQHRSEPRLKDSGVRGGSGAS